MHCIKNSFLALESCLAISSKHLPHLQCQAFTAFINVKFEATNKSIPEVMVIVRANANVDAPFVPMDV